MIALDPDNTEGENIAGVAEYVYNMNLSFPVGVETGDSAYDLFQDNYDGANPYPTDVIIDRDGIIRYIAVEYDPEAMDAVIRDLLAE